MTRSREVSYAHARFNQRPPPREAPAKRIALKRLWWELPEETRQKTLRCLANIIVGHHEPREVDDERH
jgi:hypothetical protein